MQHAINYSSFFQLEKIHNAGYKGQGIGIAILDTGIYPHQDFNHIVYFQDFVSYQSSLYDDNGHGTHVAGIVASSKIGVAPEVNLIILKVLNRAGEGKNAGVLQALDWIIKHKTIYNIRIANISIGSASKNTEQNRNLINAVNRVWDAGVIVTSAAGNQGPKNRSITTPGSSYKVITIGSCDDNINPSGKLNYSGRGPTAACIQKPDVVAPGSKILSCLNSRTGYIEKSGTSMATPFVSGVIALLLSKEPYLTPKQVKLRIYQTSLDLGKEANQQGWGLINPRGLLKV